eukprot:CAMPEP_0170564012 /NCGR_PEP_ID=MMETSP0211-20121228/70277_1 /TAXON_ID=311385 /ORGANISM="Pseudokeronopsis sp., Strain OXSARD2" /LENGTH=245 /DNA_ID=CAMNT_0010882927 /DNA_START=29 /DNA_END=762 /DNA_ORIENTATION=-
MTRHYIELVTGVYTGSNMPPEIHCIDSLISLGLKGDQTCGKEVEIVETHFPYFSKCPVTAHKAVVLKGTPLTRLILTGTLTATKTHSKGLHDDEYIRLAKEHDDFIKRQLKYLHLFYKYWIHTQKTPVLLVRYEDIVTHLERHLTQIMSFYRGGLEIKDSPYFQKIQEIVKEQKEKTLYSRTSKPFFSTLHRFSQEQFEFIAKEFEPWLTQFNYEVDLPQKKVILKEITENDFIYKHNLETMKKV